MRNVMKGWTAKQLGDFKGKTAIVTGANSGIGYVTALELGRAGANVVIACRDEKRGAEAVTKLRTDAPGALFRLEKLDLADLSSVRAFAQRFIDSGDALDLLVNNAGVMAVPERETTADGYERQMGTNHLGPFALTGLLLPALRKAKAPRVVTVSSGMAYVGRINFDNLQSEKRYSPSGAYAASKLANLYFTLELGRRAPWLTSVAAHPGAVFTNLQRYAGPLMTLPMYLIAQQPESGALPSLYAAGGEAASGEFYGPRNTFGMNGPPKQAKLPKRANDAAVAAQLWEKSEQLTGVRYDLEAPAFRKSA